MLTESQNGRVEDPFTGLATSAAFPRVAVLGSTHLPEYAMAEVMEAGGEALSVAPVSVAPANDGDRDTHIPGGSSPTLLLTQAHFRWTLKTARAAG